MEIEIMEMYREYLDILIRKKKKGLEYDKVEGRFIKALEDYDDWFVKYGVKEYL